MKLPGMPAYFKELFDRYKYILLLCLVGVVLMVWPQEEGDEARQPAPSSVSEQTQLELRIQTLLESMDGVGKARVLLTVEIGTETDYAFDQNESQNQGDTGGSRSRQLELVTVSQSGGQSPVPVRTSAPVWRGAVVVCEGGGSAAVRLEVMQVVQSLTGISADRIVISKMK